MTRYDPPPEAVDAALRAMLIAEGVADGEDHPLTVTGIAAMETALRAAAPAMLASLVAALREAVQTIRAEMRIRYEDTTEFGVHQGRTLVGVGPPHLDNAVTRAQAAICAAGFDPETETR